MKNIMTTQKDVILGLLETGKNVPLNMLESMGISATQRIAELRRDGYKIYTNFDRNIGSMYRMNIKK